jgi:integrase
VGSVYQRKDGRWVGKYQDLEGSWRYVYRKSKKEANAALREAVRNRDEGISPDRITVREYLEDWLEGQSGVVSERTLIVKRGNLRVHVYPALGDKQLSKLTGKDVRGIFKGKNLKPRTVNKILGTFSQAMDHAVGKHIRTNPAREVARLRQPQQEMEILSPEQVKRLIAACRGDRMEGVFVLGATCGLRIGEALGIRFSDIDFDKGTLTIKRTIWRGRVLPTKTKSSRRTIKLPRIALEALHRHRAEGSGTWVFPTRLGNPHYAANFYRHSWRPMLKKAGLPPITYHQLRHCAASFLLSQRVPIPVVSTFLGHANPSITLAIYSHMVDDDDGLAGNAVDKILGYDEPSKAVGEIHTPLETSDYVEKRMREVFDV